MINHRVRLNAVAVAFMSLVALFLSPAAMSQQGAVATMAGILAEMQHYPSDAEKKTLAAISSDESNTEATRTIATAILNIQHKAQTDDVEALKGVAKSGTEAEKQLASIVMNFNHQAGSDAKETLKVLAGG
eukprot:TRINITY_DN6614_c0_g1_i1.p3 TRINITY_DN6614_c0_g1~~TRINITY_DN6614_c0_g1_i1.p3  ORF type:complete len:131 (+),score=18.40 TRINITY_DN6614_c0_g1_i1:1047-1439(+)